MPWGFWAGYLERLAIVALVLLLLYLLARWLRKAGCFERGGRCVSILESTTLSQHAALHVVRAGKRYLLIGTTASGVWRIAELGRLDVEITELPNLVPRGLHEVDLTVGS